MDNQSNKTGCQLHHPRILLALIGKSPNFPVPVVQLCAYTFLLVMEGVVAIMQPNVQLYIATAPPALIGTI